MRNYRMYVVMDNIGFQFYAIIQNDKWYASLTPIVDQTQGLYSCDVQNRRICVSSVIQSSDDFVICLVEDNLSFIPTHLVVGHAASQKIMVYNRICFRTKWEMLNNVPMGMITKEGVLIPMVLNTNSVYRGCSVIPLQ